MRLRATAAVHVGRGARIHLLQRLPRTCIAARLAHMMDVRPVCAKAPLVMTRTSLRPTKDRCSTMRAPTAKKISSGRGEISSKPPNSERRWKPRWQWLDSGQFERWKSSTRFASVSQRRRLLAKWDRPLWTTHDLRRTPRPTRRLKRFLSGQSQMKESQRTR